MVDSATRIDSYNIERYLQNVVAIADKMPTMNNIKNRTQFLRNLKDYNFKRREEEMAAPSAPSYTKQRMTERLQVTLVILMQLFPYDCGKMY